MSRIERSYTRRALLKRTAIVAASGALVACQPAPAPASPAVSTPAKQEPTKAPAAGLCAVTPPGVFPVVKEKVALTAFALQDPTVENMETNQFTVEYEEKTNVHINWQLAPAQGLGEKLALVLAGGIYPDVFLAAGISRPNQMEYGQQGVLIPLNDLIEQHTVHVKQAIQNIPSLKEGITAPDGRIYALGKDYRDYHVQHQQRMWINTRWLQRLGLKAPTTTDEFYEVLKTFKAKDANGNGKADEVPLTGAGTSGTSSVTGFLMCAFVYNDGGNRFVLEDGRIDVSYNKLGWREGLQYLRKLYSEGLMDPAALTRPGGDLVKLTEQGDASPIGVCANLHPRGFCNPQGDRVREYDPLAPLKGPQGVQLTGWYPDSSVTSGLFAISKACKCPEVAIRWVDWLQSLEGTLRCRFGLEGKEWRWAEKGEKSLDGQQATFMQLAVTGTLQNYFWGQSAWPVQFDHSAQAACDDIYEPCGYQRRLYQAAELYAPYKPKAVVPAGLWFPKEDTARVSQLATEINGYVNESLARFITGDLKLDSDWDNYCKQLDKMGLAEYLALNQKAYDAKYKK